MADAEWVRQQAAVSLERLWPRLAALGTLYRLRAWRGMNSLRLLFASRGA